MKNKTKLRKFFYIIGILLGGILLAYQIFLSIKSLIAFPLPNTTIFHLVIAFIFVFIAFFIQILAWYILIKENNRKDKNKFFNLIKGYALSFVPRYLPGTIWGYISRSEWLFQEYSISHNKSNSVSILELCSTITANLLLIILWINTTFLRERIYLSLLLLLALPPLLWLLISGLFKIVNLANINFFNLGIVKFFPGSMKNWIFSTYLFLLHWFFLANGLNQILLFLGEKSLFIVDSLFATCASWLVGFLIFIVPSGIGFREMSLSFILNDMFVVNGNIVYIAVVLFRFLSILGELSWILLNFVENKQIEKKLDSNPKGLSDTME